MSPQRQVFSLVRRARAILEAAHEIESEMEDDRIAQNDPYSSSQRHWERDPLASQLEIALNQLDAVLS
jgi:hypothetical protein